MRRSDNIDSGLPLPSRLLVRIGMLVVLIGLLILLFPEGQRIITERDQKRALADAVEEIVRMERYAAEETELSAEPQWSEEMRALYEACADYNEELFLSGQEKLVDMESLEDFPVRTADYGFPEEVIGILKVPRLEVELPLYLGASSEHMSKGAALFGQTSVPLSETTHALAAICAHRGFRGTAMFREIEKMQVGDPIYITTPWEELEYRVTETRIVLPDDTSWCRIEEDRNQIVLMTCHPYTKNTHRYLVFAEKI